MTSFKKRSLEFLSLSLLIGLATSVAALIFFAWLTNEVLDGETRHFDTVTREAVHKFASPALTSMMQGLSFIGSTIFLSTATVAIVFWLAKRKLKREALLFGATMLGAAILNTTLKLTFQRPRPVPYFDLRAPETFSFPSGHSLASFCFFGALAAILTARLKNPRRNLALWMFAAIMVSLIGLSRIYLGVHYTTDVLAGFTAAFIWICVIRFLEMQWVRRKKKKTLPAE